MKKLLTILAISIIAAVSLPSCQSDDYWDDPYYYSALCGSWELYSVNDNPIGYMGYTQFTFYSDGTGTYGQYNMNGVWNTYQITWECNFPDDFNNVLYVYTWDGQVWIYNYTVTYNSLTLRDTLNGNILLYTPY